MKGGEVFMFVRDGKMCFETLDSLVKAIDIKEVWHEQNEKYALVEYWLGSSFWGVELLNEVIEELTGETKWQDVAMQMRQNLCKLYHSDAEKIDFEDTMFFGEYLKKTKQTDDENGKYNLGADGFWTLEKFRMVAKKGREGAENEGLDR